MVYDNINVNKVWLPKNHHQVRMQKAPFFNTAPVIYINHTISSHKTDITPTFFLQSSILKC